MWEVIKELLKTVGLLIKENAKLGLAAFLVLLVFLRSLNNEGVTGLVIFAIVALAVICIALFWASEQKEPVVVKLLKMLIRRG